MTYFEFSEHWVPQVPLCTPDGRHWDGSRQLMRAGTNFLEQERR